MSELPSCPYCGAMIWDTPVKYTDEGTKLICDKCARSYVYLPGYGSFALSDTDFEEYLSNTDDFSIPELEDIQDSNQDRLAKACFTLCILISGIPFVLIMIIMVLSSLF